MSNASLLRFIKFFHHTITYFPSGVNQHVPALAGSHVGD